MRGFTDCVRSRGAGGNNPEIRSAGPQIDRDQARAHIADQRGNRERRNFSRTALGQHTQLGFVSKHAADARANDDAHAVAIFLRHIQRGIFHGLPRGDIPKMRVAIVATRFLRIHVQGRIPVAHLSPDLRSEILGIKQTNPINTRAPRDQTAPESVNIMSNRSNRT